MEDLDLMARGGAATLNLYLAIRWLGVRQNCMVSTFGALFGLSTAVFILFIQKEVFYDPPLLLVPVMTFGSLCVFFFWLFAQAFFDDGFRLRAWHALPGLTIVIAALTCTNPFRDTINSTIIHLTMLLMFVHVFTLAVLDRGGDLVCKRRVFRRAMAIVVPSVGTAILVIDMTATQFPISGWGLYAQTFGVLALSALFAWWVGRIDTTILPSQEPAVKVHQAKLPAADRLELARLNAAVEDGQLYEPGLTIGMLAETIDVPEHRLRRLINQGLGYRNFNAFLNDHRVAEAQRRLSDPELAREQIIQHAFALGYASLAPFNRAFRERVGTSPSAFRASALDDALAD